MANLTQCFCNLTPVLSFFWKEQGKFKGVKKAEAIAPAVPLSALLVFNTGIQQKHCQLDFFASYVRFWLAFSIKSQKDNSHP